MGSFNAIRDAVETAGVLGGNYLLPGSSLLTSHLASKGSQDQLGSTLGTIANIGTGLVGGGFGSETTGIPSASSIGAGWTNAANGVGGLVGDSTLGTDIGNGVSSGFNSVKSGIGSLLSGAGDAVSNAASGVGNATGLSSLFGGGSSPAVSALDSALQTQASTGALAGAGQFGPSVPASIAGPGAATLSGGGAASSFGPLQIGGALLGGYNSLNANDKAQKDLLAAEANAQGAIAPYTASGGAANTQLSNLLGTSGNTGTSGYGSLTTPFTAANLTSDPGYQFQQQQGDQALQRQEAAAGNLDSGAALKAAQTFGQGLAGTTFNNAFQRDAATKAQQYGMFSGQAGAGQNAANSSGQIYQNIGNAQANNQIASSGIMNQTLSSLLSGSGAKTIKGYNPQTGQPIYG